MATNDFLALMRTGHSADIQRHIMYHLEDLSSIEEILARDVSLVNLVDKDKWTLLHWATYCRHFALAQLLLNMGAEVNLQNSSGNVPLHYACANGHLEIAKELMIQGADVTIKDRFGDSPIELCCKIVKTELERFIKDDLSTRRRRFVKEVLRRNASPSPRTTARTAVAPPPTHSRPRPRSAASAAARVVVSAPSSSSRPKPQHASTSSHPEMLELRAQLDTTTRERDEIARQRDEVTRQRDEIARDMDEITRQRDEITREMDEMNWDLHEITRERRPPEWDLAMEELEEWRAGRRVLDGDEAFLRYRPYVHRDLHVPPDHVGVRFPLSDTTPLHVLAASLCRTRGSFYSIPSPVAGFTLVRVEAVVSDDTKIGYYENYLRRMQRMRESIAAYNTNIAQFSGHQMRVLNVLNEVFHERPLESSPTLARTLYVFHGPQVGAVDGICLDGLEATRSLDPGYFGAGLYCTLNIEYAARYAMGEFDDQPLQRDFTTTGGLVPVIMFAAAVNMTYPVTPGVDYARPRRVDRHSRFFGQPLSAGFDSHVACVSQSAGFEAVQREDCQYVELVVANYQQLLPLAVLWLQPM